MLLFLLWACQTQDKHLDTHTTTTDTGSNTVQEPESPTEETALPEDTQTPEATPTSEPSQDGEAQICYPENRVPSDTLLPGESSFGISETTTQDGFTDDYLYDASNYIKIGTRRDWGGSIVFFGLSNGAQGMNSTNTIDANDTGREVQVAFYDPDRVRQGCAHDASCVTDLGTCPNSITYLGWNPVQELFRSGRSVSFARMGAQPHMHSTTSLSTCLLAPDGTANTAHSTTSLSTCLLAPDGTANTAYVGKKP